MFIESSRDTAQPGEGAVTRIQAEPPSQDRGAVVGCAEFPTGSGVREQGDRIASVGCREA